MLPRVPILTHVAFSPDGSKLASVPASNDKTILLRDGITGIFIATLEGHSNYISSMIFSADGSRLASTSRDGTVGTVRLWEISEVGRCIRVFEVESRSRWIYPIAISADGSRLASTDDATDVRFWDSSTGACIDIPRSRAGPAVHDILSRWAPARFSFPGRVGMAVGW
jgi:WD40 repeat protein